MAVELRDGTRIVIRPIEPEDRAALAEGFERLSPESRYRRFFAPVAHLSEHDLDYFTLVDHHDHEALVAVAAETGEGVGVARYVRIGPDVAEPAVVVADDWQGRGVGTRLLEALVERAAQEGIRRFEAPVLAYNAEAIHVFDRLGEVTRESQGTEVLVKVDLPAAGVDARCAPLLATFATARSSPRGPCSISCGRAAWARRATRPQRDRGRHRRLRPRGAAVEAAAELAAATGASVEVVGASGSCPAEHARVEAAVRDAAAALRERGLQAREHVRAASPPSS